MDWFGLAVGAIGGLLSLRLVLRRGAGTRATVLRVVGVVGVLLGGYIFIDSLS